MIFKLPYQKEKAISYIERNDKEMICEVRKDKRNRSTVQNSYYWLLLTMLEQDTGNDKDDLHEYFKHTLGLKEHVLIDWKQPVEEVKSIIVTASTTKFTTIEMENYLEKIRIFASRELGCFLPKPNETEFDYLQL